MSLAPPPLDRPAATMVVASIDVTAAGIALRLESPGQADATVRFEPAEGLPLASLSVGVLVDDVIARHLDPTTRLAWLRECRRVLRPGGTLELGGLGSSGSDSGESRRRDVEQLTGLVPAESSGARDQVSLRRREAARLAHPPLVSILVPAYRVEYLDEALRSATSQTWPHLEILVRDDCPDGSVAAMVQRHAAIDARVRYERNEPATGARPNYYGLFESARGDFVKYLNDDDVLHPDAVRRMAAVLHARPDVTLVTSHRRNIDESSAPLPDDEPTRAMFDADVVVPGPSAVALVFGTRLNWIGEPTTTMFRRSDIVAVEPELFSFGGTPALANGDLTLWTRLLAHGDLCYLAATLSQFRRHAAQNQVDPAFRDRALQHWDQLAATADRAGLLDSGIGHARACPLDDKPWWSDDDRHTASLLAAGGCGLHGGLRTPTVAETVEPELVVRAALAAIDTGDVDAAIHGLRRAAELDRWDARAPGLLALVCALTGDLPGALDARERAAQRAPGSDLVAEIDASLELASANR